MNNTARSVSKSIVAALGTAVLAITLLVPSAAHAQVFLSVGIAPPAIPVYEQPLCPGDGYIWTPGYWAYGDQGYFWVDGAWVDAPYQGALWTPGYWGFDNGAYLWNAGYWGNEVGYYGGIDYGFGYFGSGFYGGYWNGGRFFYNSGYNRLDYRRIHNIYNGPYRGGSPVHPGGRAFDPHPPAIANRGSAFNGGRFNGGENQGFRNNGSNINVGNRDNGGTAAQGFRGGAAAPSQGIHNNISSPTAHQEYQGGTNVARPQYIVPQRSLTQPSTQPSAPQQQPRTYSAPPAQQQHYNAPSVPQQQQRFSAPSSAAPQQHFSAPSGGNAGGGGFHGGNGGHR